MHLKMSSAVCFNLDQSKILSSGQELTTFSTLFQLHCNDQSNYLFNSTSHDQFFPSHWLLSHITTAETLDNGERGINSVLMIIINPLKEIGRAGDRASDPPVLQSGILHESSTWFQL